MVETIQERGAVAFSQATSLDPETPFPTGNPKVLVVSIGNREDLYNWRNYQYGDEVGAPRLEFATPIKDFKAAKAAIEAHIKKLQTEPEGNPVLKPGERLDKIIIKAHGAPLLVHMDGINESGLVSVASLSFMADYGKCIDFTSCNLAADAYGELGSDYASLNTTVLSYIRQDTEVDLNSTYGMGGWIPIDNPTYEKSHAATLSDRISELRAAGYSETAAEAIARSVGGERDLAAEIVMGRGGNQYRFIPNDKNGNGIYEFDDFDVVRVVQNGDCASDDVPGLPRFSTNAVEQMHQESGGKTEIRTYSPDDANKVLLNPNSDLERANRVWFRFMSQLDKGITYGDARAVDLMVSFVKLKRKDPDLYYAIKENYEHIHDGESYFSIVERMDTEIAFIPESKGRLLDDPVTTGNE